MASIYRKDDNFVPDINRNSFDISFQNNLTTNFGRLTVASVTEVLPGDTHRIEPHFALRMMPQVFPVQTRQRASLKYYYVRNRNLWKDWENFIGKTRSDLVPPFLDFTTTESQRLLHPSSLADYMGIPIHVKSVEGVTNSVRFKGPDYYVSSLLTSYYQPNGDSFLSDDSSIRSSLVTNVKRDVTSYFCVPSSPATIYPLDYILSDNPLSRPSGAFTRADNSYKYYMFRRPIRFSNVIYDASDLSASDRMFAIVRTVTGRDVAFPVYGGDDTYAIPSSVTYITDGVDTVTESILYIVGAISNSTYVAERFTVDGKIAENDDVCWCDLQNTPFYRNNYKDGIRISAMPFRAVQSIYNACIRNAENNPLLIDGVPEYNKYITNDEGGAQAASEVLNDYFSNWSDDRFTTALPSPQQGNAPLVGLTGQRDATLVVEADDGTQSTLKLSVNNSTGEVTLRDASTIDEPDNVNSEFMDAIQWGITINDLRNVNAYQRWKENNIRRGYKYRDQLKGHYGVTVKYDVLDMPEFIGGVTRDVTVSQVTQTVENEYGNLGDYAGQSYIMGDGHSIEHYCDEHGFIIGILAVYPVPIYEDLLPKHLLKNDAFDYYFPEFGKIGPQAITNKELAFSQSYQQGIMDKTFGYQRAWYDLLERNDEIHGLFHTDLRNYLLGRSFFKTPELGSEFLTMHPDDLNNTFYTEDNTDKIIGQIYQKHTVKRQIPLLGIPSIE